MFKWISVVAALISMVVASEEGLALVPDCSDRIIGFLDLKSVGNLSQVSKKWNDGVHPVIADAKQWVEAGGLLRALFLADSEKADKDRLSLFEKWEKLPEEFSFQDFLDLLTGFVSLDVDAESLEALTAELLRGVGGNPTLTPAQREFLSMWMPNKDVSEMAGNLSTRIMTGACECGKGVYSAACTCWSGLSLQDLRHITPRLLNERDEIADSEPLIILNSAFFSANPWLILLMPASLHPMPELRVVLILKLQEELAADKYSGIDLIKMGILFLMLERGEEADESFFKFVRRSEGYLEYLAFGFFYGMYKVTFKPFVYASKGVYSLLHYLKFSIE